MTSKDAKILEFNQHQKSVKAPFIIYADFECFIEKTDACKNNPENSSATRKSIFHQVFNVYNIVILKHRK